MMSQLRTCRLLFTLSLCACQSAPPKSIDEVWIPRKTVSSEADAGLMGGVMAGLSAGAEAGGAEVGGAALSGSEAGATAGEETGAEQGGAEQVELNARGLPSYEGSALTELDGELRLAWAHHDGVWMLAYDVMGRVSWERFLPWPTELSEAERRGAQLQAATLKGASWLLISTEGRALWLQALSAQPSEGIALPLEGPAQISPLNGELLITGVDPEARAAAWLSLDPAVATGPELSGQLKRAPAQWPAPNGIGVTSGQATLRFDEAGQCVSLDQRLEPINSSPCIEGASRIISDGQLSYLSYTRPGEDSVSVTLLHQAELSSSYEVLTLRADSEGLKGQRFSSQPTRRALVGLRLSEEEDGILRDRLTFIEPEGLWVSEEGWEQWPYERARLVTRRGAEAWLFLFSEAEPPQLERVALKPNEFRERAPFGFSVDEGCRPSAERCDQIDNNCDGVVDNGVCCAPFRNPIEARFRPLATPTEFYVSDNEDANVSRFIFRTAEGRWEPWGFYYPTSTRGAILVSYGLIEGAHEGLGWSAAGDYSALVARDDSGAWSVFWNHSSGTTLLKQPEPLGCERALAFGVMGYAPTATSPVVVCDDRLVHVRADRDPETDAFRLNVSHESPLAAYPPLEWATITRHFTRGNSTVSFAFESLSGTWELAKLSLGLISSELSVQVTSSLTARLGYGGAERPGPVYLHRDEAPGVPGAFPMIQLPEAAQGKVRVHLPIGGKSGAEAWREALLGGSPDQVRYAELQGKVVASRRTAEDEVSFWAIDTNDFEEPNLWSTAPSIVWRSPTGAEGVEQMRWDVIHGDYYNYIAMLSPRGDGEWAITLYSVRQCRR